MFAAFTDEQKALRGSVRESLAQLCPVGTVRAAWADRAVARDTCRGVADLGLLGVLVPEGAGGLGLDARDAVTLAYECGYVGLPGPFIDTAWVAAPALAQAGESASWLVRDLVAGTCWVSVRPPTSPFASDVDLADLVLVLEPGSAALYSPAAVSLVAEQGVDGARRPFRVTPAGAPLITLPGPSEAFDRGVLASAAFQLGLGRRMLDLALGYVKVREQFGRPVGSYQAVQHHLANVEVALAFAAPLAWRAACSLATGHPEASTHASMAHLRASGAATIAGRAALQVHGAIGYTTEHDLHLFLKRAWSMQRAWGDPHFHRRRIGAALDRYSDTKEYWDV